jgi:hypothetical protein
MEKIPENDDLPEMEEDCWEEEEFNPCSECDGHPACEDFGCAIELGIGRMVQKIVYP